MLMTSLSRIYKTSDLNERNFLSKLFIRIVTVVFIYPNFTVCLYTLHTVAFVNCTFKDRITENNVKLMKET